MALRTAVKTGKWSEEATWGATPPTTTDEAVIPSGFEVKLEAAVTCISTSVTGTGKLVLAKNLILTGTGKSLRLSTESTFSIISTGKISFTAAGGTAEPETNGKDLVNVAFTGTGSAKYKLTEALTASTEIVLKGGILTTAGFNVTTGAMAGESATTKELILGTSTLTITGSAGFSLFENEALSAAESTIILSAASAALTVNSSSGKIFGTVTFTGLKPKIEGGPTIATLNLSLTGTESEREVIFDAAKITTVTAITKSAGTQKWVSSTGGTAWKLKKTSGTLSVEQVLLKDSTAEGGATFKDIKTAEETTNVSNNTGWTFETAITTSPLSMLI